MPDSAISSELVDMVCPAQHIGARLQAHARSFGSLKQHDDDQRKDGNDVSQEPQEICVEASKEELQSINEELQAVNQELGRRSTSCTAPTPTCATCSRARRSRPCSSIGSC